MRQLDPRWVAARLAYQHHPGLFQRSHQSFTAPTVADTHILVYDYWEATVTPLITLAQKVCQWHPPDCGRPSAPMPRRVSRTASHVFCTLCPCGDQTKRVFYRWVTLGNDLEADWLQHHPIRPAKPCPLHRLQSQSAGGESHSSEGLQPTFGGVLTGFETSRRTPRLPSYPAFPLRNVVADVRL